MDPCLLAAYTQIALLLCGLGASLGGGSAHSRLGLHTSISNKDNHTHRLILSRLLLINTFFPGKSR